MQKTAIYNFLTQFKYGVVSTVSENGTPQSALVGIAITPDLQIVFDTLKTSRKYANLIARPSCSFAIGWPGERTLQFEGIAEEPAGVQLARYHQLYFSVWPECRAHLSWPAIAYFIVHPKWIRYSGYDQTPPLIEEITIP